MSYVVMIAAQGASESQVESLLQLASSFLHTSGSFKRRERGRFRRAARRHDLEEGTLRLVEFAGDDDVAWAQAKALEDILRAALKNARMVGGEVHVLLADGGPKEPSTSAA